MGADDSAVGVSPVAKEATGKGLQRSTANHSGARRDIRNLGKRWDVVAKLDESRF